MTEKLTITREMFIEAVGREPENDDLARCNCENVGELGHSSCGWSVAENRPNFIPPSNLKHRLPPDPDGQNDDRAEWALTAVEAFQGHTLTDNCDALSDLLCDLMHLCDREPDRFGTFEGALHTAKMHYEAETQEGLSDAD